MEQNCGRSQIADGAKFADGAADGAELPMNCRPIQICQVSRRFGTPQDAGPKYLPAELPQLSTEPQDPNLLFSLVACLKALESQYYCIAKEAVSVEFPKLKLLSRREAHWDLSIVLTNS
jgi:hypothetical protein